MSERTGNTAIPPELVLELPFRHKMPHFEDPTRLLVGTSTHAAYQMSILQTIMPRPRTTASPAMVITIKLSGEHTHTHTQHRAKSAPHPHFSLSPEIFRRTRRLEEDAGYCPGIGQHSISSGPSYKDTSGGRSYSDLLLK